MLLCFELSMPGVGSWDGKWTGQNNLYARVKNFGRTKKSNNKAEEILAGGYYSYSFGDGWGAGISVRQIDAKEAAKIRRKSSGFCGYEWMIESIMEHGEIRSKSK